MSNQISISKIKIDEYEGIKSELVLAIQSISKEKIKFLAIANP